MRFNRHLVIVAGIAVVLLFIKLGTISLFQVAEARNSQVPVEMMYTNEYVVPFFNGLIRTDKPPLEYYAILLAYKIGGVNEACARFFSALCGLVVIIATWFFTKRNAGSKTAWWSTLFLLASLHTVFQFRLATPDPFLIACHVLSLYCFWEGYNTGKRKYFFLMYVLLGLAILAKGPVGLLLPAGTIFLYLVFTKKFNWTTIRSFHPFIGIALILLVALPWFYLVHTQTNGEWTRGFFITHNMDRFTTPLEGRHKGPFFLPLLFIIAGLFPFSFFMIRATGFTWKQRKQNPWLFFSLLAVACIVIPYAISSTKLINYTSPAYPFLAIMTGFYIKDFIDRKITARKKLLPEWIAIGVASIALPVGVFYWMSTESTLSSISSLSSLLLVFPAAVTLGFFCYRRERLYKAFLIVASGSILQNFLFFLVLYPSLDARGSVQKQKGLVASANRVVAYRSFNNAFTFYHRKPIAIMPSVRAVVEYLKQYPKALVLERASYPHLKDSLPAVTVVRMDKDLFSRQYSIVYQLNVTQ